jgi:hypothetical protein
MRPNRSEFPLTRFLGMLLCYSDDKLRNASPGKAARHYGISPEHAAGYIRLFRENRGLV